MATKKASVGSLQKGSYVIVDGHACRVADTQTSRPGKHGHAKVRMSAVGLIDGKKRVVVMPGHDQVDVPIVEKKNAQILSIQGDTANVMDTESYETFDLKIPEDLKIADQQELSKKMLLEEGYHSSRESLSKIA